MKMRYYEGHETVYQRMQEKGCHSWDEYLGQAAGFDAFCLKSFLEDALLKSAFSDAHPLALEVGCGTGPVCCFLAGKGFRVEGMDISPTAIIIAEREARARGLKVTYSVGDVCRDDLEPQKYDLVVDGHCLHCIISGKDRRKALSGIRNAIRPGGYFWMDGMMANAATTFGETGILDQEGVLWVRIQKPGQFDLEKQIDGATYVASRRIYREPRLFEAELQEAGFTVVWSEIKHSGCKGEPGSFRAICKVDKAKIEPGASPESATPHP